MGFSSILHSVHDGIATITLNKRLASLPAHAALQTRAFMEKRAPAFTPRGQ